MLSEVFKSFKPTLILFYILGNHGFIENALFSQMGESITLECYSNEPHKGHKKRGLKLPTCHVNCIQYKKNSPNGCLQWKAILAFISPRPLFQLGQRNWYICPMLCGHCMCVVVFNSVKATPKVVTFLKKNDLVGKCTLLTNRETQHSDVKLISTPYHSEK